MRYYDTERTNHKLNNEIERFIDQWDETSIGNDIKNMYENGSSYEAICDRLDWDYKDFE